MSLFTYSPEDYIRNVDIIPAYIEDCSFYISRMLNKPIEVAREFVKQEMRPGGAGEFKDPEVLFLLRDQNGDRAKKKTTFTKYLSQVSSKKFVMAPTMTVYLNPDQETSLLAEYITGNLLLRKDFKHKMFQAKMSKDEVRRSYFDGLQNSSKIKNNSVSGAHASPSTILHNKSSHSTLTSTCRISTSYANASNEWYLAGNRHLWGAQVIITSLITACRHADLEMIDRCIANFDLVYPTASDVMECIRYSADNYFRDERPYVEINDFVTRMTPTERASFVYTSDLYHLAKHNPSFVREFLDELSTPETWSMPFEEAEEYMKKKIDSAQQDFVVLLCAKIMNGRPLYGDGTENDESVYKNDHHAYGILGATAKRVLSVLDQYKLLIHALWRPSVLPPSISQLPSIMRRVVVTSDTDSTIFTNQHWTEWFTDSDSFCEKAYAIGYTTTYLTSQLVKHKLALMSANIGIITKHVHKISMKNEYYFPVFSLTPVAKHYYAFRSAQEGNILPEMETEIKGVHLRDSTAPSVVTKKLKGFMEMIMSEVIKRGALSMDEVFGPVAELELDIADNLKSGGYKYLKSLQIKDLNSYVKKEEAANYKHHLFWNEIFGWKYGMQEEPPYGAVKVSVDLGSKGKIKRWLDEMEDQELAERLRKWAVANNKDSITTMVLPVPIIETNGIPIEIRNAMNIRKLTINMVKPFYLVLSSLGVYMLDENITKLLSDVYIPLSRRVPPVVAA